MKRSAVVLALFLASTQAQALSCLAPDPVTSFHQAANSHEIFHVYHGTFTFDGQLSDGREVLAVFNGQGLTKDGFVPVPERTISVASRCAASWCGQYQSGQNVLAFVRRTNLGQVFDISPCGNWDFPNPSTQTLDAMVGCISGDACEANFER